jgi:hypothetical protein
LITTEVRLPKSGVLVESRRSIATRWGSATYRSNRMPVTLRQTVYALAICAAFMAFGLFTTYGAWNDWVHQEIYLRHRTVPRLISYAANRDELILRCASLALFGGFWLWTGFALGCGLLHRAAVLRQRFFADAVKPPLGVLLLLWIGLSCLAVWFPLMCFIKLHYP